MELERIILDKYPKARSKISSAKIRFLKAVTLVIEENQDYWPLSIRYVHYRLLGRNVITNSDLGIRYVNNRNSYAALSRLLTQARLEGRIDWECFEDLTRPVVPVTGFPNVASFYRQEWNYFMTGYSRRLSQSQPNYIEVVAEKLTVQSILEPVVRKYGLPMTIIRGQCSVTAKQELYERFQRSGKEKFVLLMATDLDPSGDRIAEVIGDYLKRDCGLERNRRDMFRAALTYNQVQEFNLPQDMIAKKTDKNFAWFKANHNGRTDVYELDALLPEQLAGLLERGIQQVMDMDLYRQELENEGKDVAQVSKEKQRIMNLAYPKGI